MGVRFRKTITFGPLRFTLTPKGISQSIGAGPVRVTKRADGKIQTTTRIPGTGISFTDTVKMIPAPTPSPQSLMGRNPPKPFFPLWFKIVMIGSGLIALSMILGR